MHDGRDDSVGGMGEDERDAGQENLRPDLREQVRDHVRTLRHGTADGCGELMIAPAPTPAPPSSSVTPPPREEARENARPSATRNPSEDRDGRDAIPAADAAFEARCKPLTARQLAAINLITMGRTIVATARTLKVDPGTIHRWKATHPLFIAELNRRQAAMFDETVTKLRLTMSRAVDELHSIVTGPSKRERAEATWKLLPMLRPAKLLVPTAPTTATAVIDAGVRAARAQRGEVVEGEITLEDRLALVPT